MLVNYIFTLLWVASFAAAFPSFSWSKWQRRSAEPVAAAVAEVEVVAEPSSVAVGGFCGQVVEVEKQPEPEPEPEKTKQQDGTAGPTETLAPSVHWSWDTKSLKNIEPVAAKEKSHMYYGQDDPTKEGYFAFLTFHFTLPSVNLDHCDHVTVAYTKEGGMKMSFTRPDAFKRATESWDADKDMLLIANVEGCAGPTATDRCYFHATSITMDEKSQTVTATGAPEDPEKIMNYAETEWGMWAPHNSTGGGSVNATASQGQSFNYTSKAPGDSSDTHGLTTAEFGPSFDSSLDDAKGYRELQPDAHAFLQQIISDGEALTAQLPSSCSQVSTGELRLRRALRPRGFWSDLWNGVVDGVTSVYNTVADALSIGGDFNAPVSWDLPGPDPRIPRETSPWSENSIALFKHEKASESGDFQEHINVYCVDCGVSGQAVFSGKAKITPLKGIFDGELGLHTNMKIILKVGVDAEIKFSQNIQQDLFSFGLPGLSYGIVTVGPYISVAAKVGLEAAAKGKLLVGAEMGLTQAQAVLYIFDPSSSTASGWTPYFKPVLTAEGEVMLAAKASLPIGIKVGLKVASFETALGLVDEPAISAVAQVAGSAQYEEGRGFTGGFKEINGCPGISTSLNWSNKLSLDILGITSKVISDTGLQPIIKGCVNLKQIAQGKPPSLPQVALSNGIETSTKQELTGGIVTTTGTPVQPSISLVTTESSVESSTVTLSSPTPTTNSAATSQSSIATSIATRPVPFGNSTSHGNSSVTTEISVKSSVVPQPIQMSNSTLSSSPSVTVQSSIKTSTVALPVPSINSGLFNNTSAVPQNVSCNDADSKPHIFREGHKFELAPLLTSIGTSMVAACNDGNIYVAAASNATNAQCTTQWPTSAEAVIPFDGSLNVMHYYEDTMSAVGVSRLRSSPAHKMPKDAVVTVLVPAPAADGSFFYMAADASRQVFYPVVCDFVGGAVPRVFLAKDLSRGIQLLEGGSVAQSIIGAKVEKCFGLSLSPRF